MAHFGVPVQNTMVTRVSLTFSCKGLLEQDLTSKSDPIVQVMMDYGGRWKEVSGNVDGLSMFVIRTLFV